MKRNNGTLQNVSMNHTYRNKEKLEHEAKMRCAHLMIEMIKEYIEINGTKRDSDRAGVK